MSEDDRLNQFKQLLGFRALQMSESQIRELYLKMNHEIAEREKEGGNTAFDFAGNIRDALDKSNFPTYTDKDIIAGALLCWKGISISKKDCFNLGTMGFIGVLSDAGLKREDNISDPFGGIIFSVPVHSASKCASFFLQKVFGPVGTPKRTKAESSYLQNLKHAYHTTAEILVSTFPNEQPMIPAILQYLSDTFPNHCE